MWHYFLISWCCKTLPICFLKTKRNKTTMKKRTKGSPGGSRTQDLWRARATFIHNCARQPLLNCQTNCPVLNIFCPWNSAGGRCLKFMTNLKIYSRETSMVLTVKLSRKTVAKSLAGFYMGRINHDSARVNISVFIEQRNISFQNEILLKATRFGVLWREK